MALRLIESNTVFVDRILLNVYLYANFENAL